MPRSSFQRALPPPPPALPSVIVCFALLCWWVGGRQFRSIQRQSLPSPRQWQGHLDPRYQKDPKEPPNLSYFGLSLMVCFTEALGMDGQEEGGFPEMSLYEVDYLVLCNSLIYG